MYISKYLTTIIYTDATFGFLALLWGSATIGLKLAPSHCVYGYISGLGGRVTVYWALWMAWGFNPIWLSILALIVVPSNF